MRIYITLLLCVALCSLIGCSPYRNLSTNNDSTQKDSIRIEYRDSIVFVPDTIYVDIPMQYSERTALDSSSHLETEYAVSDVRINADGTLYHSLSNKALSLPIKIEKQIEYKDRILYKDRIITKTKNVVVEKKMTIQKTLKVIGITLAVVGVVLLILKLKHYFL